METYLLLLSITSGRDKVKREWEALRGMWDWDFFFHHALPTQPNMSFSVRNLVSFCSHSYLFVGIIIIVLVLILPVKC